MMEPKYESRSKISNKPSYTSQGIRKEQTKPKVSRMKEIKVRSEINEIESRKTVEKINDARSWFSEDKQNWQNFC